MYVYRINNPKEKDLLGLIMSTHDELKYVRWISTRNLKGFGEKKKGSGVCLVVINNVLILISSSWTEFLVLCVKRVIFQTLLYSRSEVRRIRRRQLYHCHLLPVFFLVSWFSRQDKCYYYRLYYRTFWSCSTPSLFRLVKIVTRITLEQDIGSNRSNWEVIVSRP